MDAVNFAKEIPSWLDQELFDKAIQSYASDQNAKVTSFDIKAATEPGKNFASAVFRAAVKFTAKYQQDEKEVSLVIKTQPATVDLKNMAYMNDTTLFDTEIGMYTNVLGQIQELLTSAGYKDVVGPRLIYQTMTPKPVIILEDVSAVGFDPTPSAVLDDIEFSKIVLKYLAKFHAAGFYLHDEQKINATSFDSMIFQTGDFAKAISTKSYEYLAHIMSEWDGFEKFVEPTKHFKEIFLQKNTKTYSPNSGPGAFNILNHGDFLMKNSMYRMKKEGEDDGSFMTLDFQISVYASPAIDLTYFLYSLVSDENRITHYDEFLFIYHTQFVEALKKFGYLKQPPSLLDLQVEMLKNGNFAAHFLMTMYPFFIFDMSTLTAEDMKDGLSKIGILMYSNERFKKVARKELELYLMKGYLGD